MKIGGEYMSMHLLPAYFNSNGNSKRKRKAKSTLTEHDKWLIKQGLHLSQIKKKKSIDFSWKQRYNDDMMVDRSTKHYDNKELVAGDCSKRDIMTNLHKEPEHVQAEIMKKASLVMPLYNKGGLQYAGPDVDLTTVGTRSRR